MKAVLDAITATHTKKLYEELDEIIKCQGKATITFFRPIRYGETSKMLDSLVISHTSHELDSHERADIYSHLAMGHVWEVTA